MYCNANEPGIETLPDNAQVGSYHVLQYGGVGVYGLVSACSTHMEGVVHVGVGGGKPPSLQPTEEERKQKKSQMTELNMSVT